LDILGEGRRRSNCEGALERHFFKPKCDVYIKRLVSSNLTSSTKSVQQPQQVKAHLLKEPDPVVFTTKHLPAATHLTTSPPHAPFNRLRPQLGGVSTGSHSPCVAAVPTDQSVLGSFHLVEVVWRNKKKLFRVQFRRLVLVHVDMRPHETS